ncbi:uncharacterized protein LOC142817956 isoform X2 [Rhipicephalus microplus]|uniref:uncharacterized protein LOC142817956 isoform X2 n=1 Tax=Rhipicephalus microplus TaxID=6941 RepID=UPI003F6D5AE6
MIYFISFYWVELYKAHALLHQHILPEELVQKLREKKFKMKQLLGMDLLVAVAVALAVIIMAPNEAVALGDGIGGISSIGLPKK